MFTTERTVPDALSLETAGPVRQFITSGSENENVPDKSIFRNQFVQALTTKNADLYRDDYLTGTLDRLYKDEHNEWTVVDYKTNRPPPLDEAEVAPQYLRQMALYRAALRGIYPDRPIDAVLLWTDAPRAMWLSDLVLAPYEP